MDGTTNTIEPIEISLLTRHASLPPREVVLERFAHHYLESKARASAYQEVLASEPDEATEAATADVADFESLAAEAIESGLMTEAAVADAAPQADGDSLFGGDEFDLGEDPFASLDAEVPPDAADAAAGAAADGDAAAEDAAVVNASDEVILSDDGEFGTGEMEGIEADASADAAPVSDDAEFDGAATGDFAPAVTADADADGAEDQDEVANPDTVQQERIELPEGEFDIALADDAEAAPGDEATTMIAAMPDDDEGASDSSEAAPEDATAMVQAMPDEDEFGLTLDASDDDDDDATSQVDVNELFAAANIARPAEDAAAEAAADDSTAEAAADDSAAEAAAGDDDEEEGTVMIQAFNPDDDDVAAAPEPEPEPEPEPPKRKSRKSRSKSKKK